MYVLYEKFDIPPQREVEDDLYFNSKYLLKPSANFAEMEHIYEEILSPCKRLKVSGNGLPQGAPHSIPPLKGYQAPPPSVMSTDDKKSRPLKVLQNEGQIRLSAYMNFGLLTVHVIQARHLTSKSSPLCNAVVKMSLVPDDTRKSRCRTDVVNGSNNPLFDEKFSFELFEEDNNKRLLISLWNKEANNNEFLGCTSFGIRHLINGRKDTDGWYYLLTEEVGRKKHLKVSSKNQPKLQVRSQRENVPPVNKDVWGMESVTVTVHRGEHGYGFSVIESCPVKVGRVDRGSPADHAGLCPGDCIIRVNNQNVSRSQSASVAKLVKNSGPTLIIDLQRPKSYEILETPSWQQVLPPNSSIEHMELRRGQDDNNSGELSDDSKGTDGSVDEGVFSLPSHLITSTPLPLFMNGHQTVPTRDKRKQEAIHRLMSIEMEFIDVMHAGMQRYSRPLRHCILNPRQHFTLFQNIEKLVTISEYHLKQIHDNMPSFCSDTEGSFTSSEGGQNFSIGMIYQSKVHMLSQAYELYSKGLGEANELLLELRKSTEFVKFVKDPPLEPQQPSISTFLTKPVHHIREMYQVLQDIFINTLNEESDFKGLKQVVESLNECVGNISNYSCVDRVPSISSLASSTGSTGHSKTETNSMSGKGTLAPSCSMNTVRSVDSEVARIQDRLVFSSNAGKFQLCTEDRHLIYAGDMFRWEGTTWKKLFVLLFSDILVQTEQDRSDQLHVLYEPVFLKHITQVDGQRNHTTELVLHFASETTPQGVPITHKMLFRAPTTELKYTWKSLLEQKVHNVRGITTDYYSLSDCSAGSAVII
ncbi:uncharacterized protein LOC133174226 [Saccostrea echinata]|uniref:uncharacterized protein LOC133174226 n=1 Tax=Saccostrea echinata TaxID=191078 RepID=UPI002A8089FD|nr:uncharacterized protein LOC133174226 [Saccostrea echinata]